MNHEEQDAYDEALRIIENARIHRSTDLKLGGMGLTQLPPEIGNLASLVLLDLSQNYLSTLPPEIGKLRALNNLNLQSNQLSFLPSEIGHLNNLEGLFISSNQLMALPSEIGLLVALDHLFLHSNHLHSLPPEIVELAALKYLTLGSNRFTSLPIGIGQLHSLRILDLRSNELGALPQEIRQLTALTDLFLDGNPKLGIPNSILGARPSGSGSRDKKYVTPRAILDFYFSIQSEGKRPLNEVKLLLVGRGEAGKTSISRALRGESYDLDQKETSGIEIEPWTLACPDGEDVTVYLWDFAGQEITHETHRFFLTERSLYVVVLDGRGGQQMEEAEYWLSHVGRYGTRRPANAEPEHSPVIVVLNKWQSPGPYDVEKRRLQREYPFICAFVETDCKEGYGIPELKSVLCDVLKQMPSVRQEWPLNYYNVRKQLKALAEDTDPSQRKYFVNWDGYREICEGSGVIDLSEQKLMAENLNALGVALYYGDHERLQDTRVLNPNWVANGLYGLVRGVHRKPYKGKPGHLWAGEFPAVLEEGMRGMSQERGATFSDYPEEREDVKVHEFLLELMQERELAFPAKDIEGQPLYLLPGLLSLDEPEVDDYDIAAHMEHAEVRFRYLYELLPVGVISRFIVRTHTLSEHFFRWQRGTVIGWGNARALLIAERRRNPRVDVFITGGTAEERQDLAGVVRSNMEVIHRGLPEGLAGKEELNLMLPGENYETMEKLILLEKENQPIQVVTTRGTRQVPVTPELDQVQPSEARQDTAAALKIFVSYSHADYKWLDTFQPYLDILKNDGKIVWWFDGKIRKGSDWDNAIRRQLEEADVVILLMSVSFFASPYINGVEIEKALTRHERGKTKILPILLSPCAAFTNHSLLKRLQAVPSVEGQLRPLSTFKPAVNGWNLVDVALRNLIKEIVGR